MFGVLIRQGEAAIVFAAIHKATSACLVGYPVSLGHTPLHPARVHSTPPQSKVRRGCDMRDLHQWRPTPRLAKVVEPKSASVLNVSHLLRPPNHCLLLLTRPPPPPKIRRATSWKPARDQGSPKDQQLVWKEGQRRGRRRGKGRLEVGTTAATMGKVVPENV
jgi:hypothetical protein